MLSRTLRLVDPPMTGPDVEALQRRLNQKGFLCAVDGVYGTGTALQVVAAKKALNYPPWRQQGFAGPLFRRLLRTLPDAVKLILPAVFVPTHETGGLTGFPAIDVFARPGTTVGAPEPCRMVYRHTIDWSLERRVGGLTCYLQSVSGDTYFVTHFGSLGQEGAYAKGQLLGTVGFVPNNWWAAHIHEGKHRGRYEPRPGSL